MIFFKSIFVFALVFVIVRIMGKRQLSEMQPFELVITLIVAEVACIPMNDPAIPLYHGIVPILTLATIHVVISFISQKSMKIRKAMSGQSVIAIDKNGINYLNLKKLNMNVNDLIEAARADGYFDFNNIIYAIFETNGKLCVLERPQDPNKVEPPYLPITLFIDGAWEDSNLKLIAKSKQDIEKEIIDCGYSSLKEILYMDIRQNGLMYISPKKAKYFTKTIDISAGGEW